MEFLLGVITGLTSAILYGHYLNNQRKKEQEKQVKDFIGGVNTFASIVDEMARWKGFDKPLTQQLQDAIDREDFKEAARLRDLMNKK